jgi:hypothetical protein
MAGRELRVIDGDTNEEWRGSVEQVAAFMNRTLDPATWFYGWYDTESVLIEDKDRCYEVRDNPWCDLENLLWTINP